MSERMGYDVVVLGEPLLERHADAAGRPSAPDAISGDAFNAACAAALAGARVALLTALGRDPGGDRVVEELERRGIATGYIKRDARPTGAYTVTPAPDGGTMFTYQRAGSAASALDASHLARWRSVIQDTPVLVTGGVCAALGPGSEALVGAAVAAAREAGRTVCYDVNFRPRLTGPADALRALRTVAPSCGVIKIATPGDTGPLLGLTTATEVIAAIRRLTGAAVIVTDGGDPLTLSAAGAESRVPVLAAPALVDATGAGDVLLGTLAAALALGTDIHAALPEAMAAAALSTCRRGGAPHASRDEVLALLRDHA